MKKPVYLIAVIGLLYCCGNPNPILPNSSVEPSIIPTPNPDDWWQQRHEEKTDLMSRENDFDLVFIGGSTTQLWESQGINSWNEMKARYKIANLGFGGDRTENALWRLRNGEFPANINVQYVVLHIGNNNSGAGHEPEATAAGIGEIIKTLHENAPSAKIILVSILPVGADNNDAIRKRNNRVNEIIKQAYNGHPNVLYYDIYDRFISPDGSLKQELYVGDNVHFSAAGYALQKELLLQLMP
jgi:lysophospholipase L1-like esterase